MNQNFCQYCGNALTGTEANCPKCGGPVPQVVQQTMQQPTQPQYVQQPVMQQQYTQSQAMGGMNQQQYVQPQQMVQQPQMNYATAATQEMPMTYHNVYMGLSILIIIINILGLFEEFESSTLITVGFMCAMVYGLFKRKKWGRILTIIYNVLLTLGGVLCSLCALMFQDAFAQLGLGAFAGSVTILMLAMGVGLAVWGVLTIIYYNKRANCFN